MKLLNDPQIESSLRALERATARTNDVCQTTRAGRPANPRGTATRSTPTPAMGVARASAPTPTRPARLGTRVVGVVGVGGGVVVVGLLASVSGCPRLPPVSGCTVGTMSCEGDRPRVCSASQRWEFAGDRPCSAVGGVCVVDDVGTAHCGRGAR
jgi:hypothetical protein